MTRILSSLALSGALTVAGIASALPLAAQPLQLQTNGPGAAASNPGRATPLPPARPQGLGVPRAGTAQAAAPVVTAASEPRATVAQQARPARPAGPLSDAEAVARLNAYFNGFSTLQGDFVQQAVNGRRLEGRLYIQRPGKMRFDYDAPVTTEIVADGTSVAIRDRRLATQDLYSIGQTPLKFLVKEKIDLARDASLTGVSTRGDIVSVKIEDRSTLGGTSKITLNFDIVANELKQWVVIDPQGYETTVSLSNLDTQRRPDPKNFVINYERVL